MDTSSGNLIIVSGMSGAGPSSVADVLEDLGLFVVDNLPTALWSAVGPPPRVGIT